MKIIRRTAAQQRQALTRADRTTKMLLFLEVFGVRLPLPIPQSAGYPPFARQFLRRKATPPFELDILPIIAYVFPRYAGEHLFPKLKFGVGAEQLGKRPQTRRDNRTLKQILRSGKHNLHFIEQHNHERSRTTFECRELHPSHRSGGGLPRL